MMRELEEMESLEVPIAAVDFVNYEPRRLWSADADMKGPLPVDAHR